MNTLVAPTSVSASCGEVSSSKRIAAFFSGAGLPVFLLSAVFLYEGILLAIVFAPAGWGIWSAFSVEFKVWCFGYDQRTGGMQWAAFWVMLAEPLFIAVTTAFLWRRALRQLAARGAWRAALRPFLAGGLAACLIGTGLFLYGQPGGTAEEALPFPGARIRTAIAPPPFRFIDHKGAEVGLSDLRGRVVLVTGIYAQCSTSCPEILAELKGLTNSLPSEVRDRLTLLALSLNPEYDTAELMARLAAGHGFAYPEFRYVNGEPGTMGDVLQRLGFSRVKNRETGLIEHANLILLVDGAGNTAYRFNVSSMPKGWMREAVVQLSAEVEK